MIRKALSFFLVFIVGIGFVFSLSASEYPRLTGRVVDRAGVVSLQTKKTLTQMLLNLERATKVQLVIVTVPNLGGDNIEQYGYMLGRRWGIGQKGKDNGALIIVAVKERAIRIEVGYGLESKLTDAFTSQIINRTMIPLLKKGNYNQALLNATRAVADKLGVEHTYRSKQSKDSNNFFGIFWFILIIIIIILRYKKRGIFFGGGGGFSGGGGGFSGGGGSFGGGGSSGRF